MNQYSHPMTPIPPPRGGQQLSPEFKRKFRNILLWIGVLLLLFLFLVSLMVAKIWERRWPLEVEVQWHESAVPGDSVHFFTMFDDEPSIKFLPEGTRSQSIPNVSRGVLDTFAAMIQSIIYDKHAVVEYPQKTLQLRGIKNTKGVMIHAHPQNLNGACACYEFAEVEYDLIADGAKLTFVMVPLYSYEIEIADGLQDELYSVDYLEQAGARLGIDSNHWHRKTLIPAPIIRTETVAGNEVYLVFNLGAKPVAGQFFFKITHAHERHLTLTVTGDIENGLHITSSDPDTVIEKQDSVPEYF